MVVHRLRWNVLASFRALIRKRLEGLSSGRKEQGFRMWNNLLNLYSPYIWEAHKLLSSIIAYSHFLVNTS